MNSVEEALARRKELLLARSSLQRLEVARDLHALRESFRLPRVGLAFAASAPVRSLLFSLLLRLSRRHRVGRFAMWGLLGIALLRLLTRASGRRGPESSSA